MFLHYLWSIINVKFPVWYHAIGNKFPDIFYVFVSSKDFSEGL